MTSFALRLSLALRSLNSIVKKLSGEKTQRLKNSIKRLVNLAFKYSAFIKIYVKVFDKS